MFQKNLLFGFAVAATFGITACSTKTQDTTFSLNDVTFKTDTPVSVGSNTMQAEATLNLEEWAAKNGTSVDAIEKVTVASVTAMPTDSTNLANLESLLFQIAGEGVSLTDVAVANPLEQGKPEVALKIAKETDVTAAFKSGKPLTVVLDANATGDDAKTASFKANVGFTIAVKAK